MEKNPNLDLSCLDDEDKSMEAVDAAEEVVAKETEVEKAKSQDVWSEKATDHDGGVN